MQVSDFPFHHHHFPVKWKSAVSRCWFLFLCHFLIVKITSLQSTSGWVVWYDHGSWFDQYSCDPVNLFLLCWYSLPLYNFDSQVHPGTQVALIDLYDNLASLKPLWKQVQGFRKAIYPITQKAPDGVHLLCFSQGPFSHSHKHSMYVQPCTKTH